MISYGEHADAVLATARRTADSAAQRPGPGRCATRRDSTSPRSSGWDTLGFRGTCSLGFLLEATGPGELVCDVPFGEISSATMLPVSHLLWSSLWLGLADEATARAQQFVRKAARKDLTPGPAGCDPAGRAAGDAAAARGLGGGADRALPDQRRGPRRSPVDFMVAINTLKVTCPPGRRRGRPGDADLRDRRLPRGLRVLPGPAAARRPRRRGDGQQRPDHRQHGPARPGPAGREWARCRPAVRGPARCARPCSTPACWWRPGRTASTTARGTSRTCRSPSSATPPVARGWNRRAPRRSRRCCRGRTCCRPTTCAPSPTSSGPSTCSSAPTRPPRAAGHPRRRRGLDGAR